jgi:hypothetical protein
MIRRQKITPELTPYQKKLLDPRWQKRRLGILQRDTWECQWCGDKKSTLHVHHLYYMQEQEPWDYPDDGLVTLCAECHEEETACRRDEEESLLLSLRKRRVFFTQIHNLAEALLHVRIPASDGFPNADIPLMSAITWAMENEKMMTDIFLRWAESIRGDYEKECERRKKENAAQDL